MMVLKEKEARQIQEEQIQLSNYLESHGLAEIVTQGNLNIIRQQPYLFRILLLNFQKDESTQRLIASPPDNLPGLLYSPLSGQEYSLTEINRLVKQHHHKGPDGEHSFFSITQKGFQGYFRDAWAFLKECSESREHPLSAQSAQILQNKILEKAKKHNIEINIQADSVMS